MNSGLKFLALEAEKKGVNFEDSNKVMILPFCSFLDLIYETMNKYIKKPDFGSWGESIILNYSDRIVSNLFGTLGLIFSILVEVYREFA